VGVSTGNRRPGTGTSGVGGSVDGGNGISGASAATVGVADAGDSHGVIEFHLQILASAAMLLDSLCLEH